MRILNAVTLAVLSAMTVINVRTSDYLKERTTLIAERERYLEQRMKGRHLVTDECFDNIMRVHHELIRGLGENCQEVLIQASLHSIGCINLMDDFQDHTADFFVYPHLYDKT